jgi:hypothetical protein
VTAGVTGHRARIADALRAVAVTPTSYAWFGRRVRPLPPDLLATVGPGAARATLVDALCRELYRSFYTQGRAVPETPERPAPARPDRDFAAALSAANAGTGGWQPGWRVQTWEGETIVVAADGVAVRAHPADCRTDGRAPAPGAAVSIRRTKELRAASPGFYIALGDRQPGPGQEVRVYFHVTAAGAAPLVAACTSVLNAAAVPFVLKVVDRPGGFTRCDAAVLYLQRGGFAAARPSLASVAAACAPHLRPGVPAFTKALAPGIAVAEHQPELGASFGTGRCRLVAEAAVQARELGAAGLDARLETVARLFADHGLDIDRPYLAAGSATRYAL